MCIKKLIYFRLKSSELLAWENSCIVKWSIKFIAFAFVTITVTLFLSTTLFSVFTFTIFSFGWTAAHFCGSVNRETFACLSFQFKTWPETGDVNKTVSETFLVYNRISFGKIQSHDQSRGHMFRCHTFHSYLNFSFRLCCARETEIISYRRIENCIDIVHQYDFRCKSTFHNDNFQHHCMASCRIYHYSPPFFDSHGSDLDLHQFPYHIYKRHIQMYFSCRHNRSYPWKQVEFLFWKWKIVNLRIGLTFLAQLSQVSSKLTLRSMWFGLTASTTISSEIDFSPAPVFKCLSSSKTFRA